MERKPREFWERHVRGFAGGGEPRRTYCAAHGLNRNTFDAWRRRIVAEREGAAGTAFVPLRVQGAAPARTSVALRWPSGVELSMPRDCDPAWLAQVLSGLR